MATCAISTLIQQACANDFVTAANDVQLYRAIKHQLLCNISANGGGGGGAVWGAITGDINSQADLVAALAAAGNGGANVYRALLNQSGTNAPVATVLQNNVGAIVWSRVIAGRYVGILAGAFLANKTWYSILRNETDNNAYLQPAVTIKRVNDNVFQIETVDATTVLADDILINHPIEILVYP